MIYKDFVAEAAQKIMAAAIADKNAESLNNDNESLAEYARGSVNAAKALADALDQDWQSTPVDGIHRFSEKEEYFDNYVNWTQNRYDGRRAVSHLQGPVPCILATTGSISNGASLFVEHELSLITH